MNKLLVVSLLMLSGCTQADLFGNTESEYNTSDKIKNRVGPNGELISPENCPNWTASPITTYGNEKQGNFGCATVTNLGLMLENPRDLEKGASYGRTRKDTAHSSDAIRNYRNELSSGPIKPTPMSVTGAAGDE